MRLLTHNLLASNVKGAKSGFPLKIHVFVQEEHETAFNKAFLLATLRKINWIAFREAADSLGVPNLPELPPDLDKCDDSMLRKFHHALMEVHVKEGYLICPDTGRRFPITKGIPNMLLNEDEVC
mmetsp:Transcript_11797/g.45704  ORF Transcript_11797/g.45704 Transcript_11797/m.45704 type:complete len:124 (-) Transcript_11797:808-1179(-)